MTDVYFKIPVKLDAKELEALSNRVGCNGMTISELVENFLNDFMSTNRRNGSDESELANKWFDRCSFQMGWKNSFLEYLINSNQADEFSECVSLKEYLTHKGKLTPEESEDLKESEETLENLYKEYVEEIEDSNKYRKEAMKPDTIENAFEVALKWCSEQTDIYFDAD